MASRNILRPDFDAVLRRYFSFGNESQNLEPLSQVLRAVKRADFQEVVSFLRDNEDIAENFSAYLHNIFGGKPFTLSLTEANILSETAFISEFKKRLLNTFIPPVEDEETVWHVVDTVSVRPKQDLAYFRAISREQADDFFRLLKIDKIISRPEVKQQILFSMEVLAWRAIGSALDQEIFHMVPEYRSFDNPFIALQDELSKLVKIFEEDPGLELSSQDENLKQIKVYLTQCEEFVDNAFKNASVYGISGKINQSLLKIRQMLKRISECLDLLVIDSEEDVLRKSQDLVMNIMEYKSHRNNLRELANDSTRLISHLITNHTAETGSHYITATAGDYLKMFWKASGGGVIVGALCILKLLYGFAETSEFGHAFLYSLNYSMGFIMINLLGFTLATKQPAMTAAALARELSEGNNTEKNFRGFAHTVARLVRSQFIAFVGNVLWAFPAALLLIYGLDVLFTLNFAAPKAEKLLADLNPRETKVVLHSCIAGVFLFISGIIAGNVGNNSVYYQMPKRLANNRILITLFGKPFAEGVSRYYAKNWAGIMSNFWFGIFMGITAPVGHFLGLDLDIRHITFAAGNLALGLYGHDFIVENSTLWISIFTVFLIGFLNFAVSFGLSMILAMRSRKIDAADFGEINSEIFKYFIKKPALFFFPIQTEMDNKTGAAAEEFSKN